jgi:hypothetical protein
LQLKNRSKNVKPVCNDGEEALVEVPNSSKLPFQMALKTGVGFGLLYNMPPGIPIL